MSRTLLTPAQRRAIRGLQGKLDTLTEGEASRGRMEGKEDTRDWLLASFASDNDGSSFASVVMDEWTTHLHEICARLAKTNYETMCRDRSTYKKWRRETLEVLVQATHTLEEVDAERLREVSALKRQVRELREENASLREKALYSSEEGTGHPTAHFGSLQALHARAAKKGAPSTSASPAPASSEQQSPSLVSPVTESTGPATSEAPTSHPPLFAETSPTCWSSAMYYPLSSEPRVGMPLPAVNAFTTSWANTPCLVVAAGDGFSGPFSVPSTLYVHREASGGERPSSPPAYVPVGVLAPSVPTSNGSRPLPVTDEVPPPAQATVQATVQATAQATAQATTEAAPALGNGGEGRMPDGPLQEGIAVRVVWSNTLSSEPQPNEAEEEEQRRDHRAPLPRKASSRTPRRPSLPGPGPHSPGKRIAAVPLDKPHFSSGNPSSATSATPPMTRSPAPLSRDRLAPFGGGAALARNQGTAKRASPRMPPTTATPTAAVAASSSPSTAPVVASVSRNRFGPGPTIPRNTGPALPDALRTLRSGGASNGPLSSSPAAARDTSGMSPSRPGHSGVTSSPSPSRSWERIDENGKRRRLSAGAEMQGEKSEQQEGMGGSSQGTTDGAPLASSSIGQGHSNGVAIEASSMNESIGTDDVDAWEAELDRRAAAETKERPAEGSTPIATAATAPNLAAAATPSLHPAPPSAPAPAAAGIPAPLPLPPPEESVPPDEEEELRKLGPQDGQDSSVPQRLRELMGLESPLPLPEDDPPPA